MKLHYPGYTDEQVIKAYRDIQDALNYWIFESVGSEYYEDDFVEKMQFLEARIDESVYEPYASNEAEAVEGLKPVELIEPEEALSAEDFETYMNWAPVGFMKARDE